MYDAKALKNLTEATNKKIKAEQEKDVRYYAENVLDAKLYAQAMHGQDEYRIEVERISCNMGMLMNYLNEHGYRVYVEKCKVMVIKW